ncbi:MAG: hypothetical protein ACI9PP_002368, partial [Halobacteriales archaeon]
MTGDGSERSKPDERNGMDGADIGTAVLAPLGE